MKKMVLLLLCAGLFVAGCSTLLTEVRDPERTEQVTGIDKHSTYPAVRREAFERINLLELVDPERQAKKAFPDSWKAADDRFKQVSADDPYVYEKKSSAMSAMYDLALAAFRQDKTISAEQKAHRRNSIQERMLSVSISRCNVFKTYLRRDQADKNFLLGTATTVAGVLGAIIPGADAGRWLAGTAGIFSGIRSEYNEAYFAKLAAHVIAKGIETRQEIVYRRIQTEGQNKSIDLYPLEAAIKDAIYFDGLCSVVAGLDQASASIDATTEPGMEAATRTVLRARLLKEAADMPGEKLLTPGTLESMKQAGAQLGLSLVGSVRGEPAGDALEADLSVAASKMVGRIDAAADAAAQAIAKEALDRKKALLEKAAPAKAESLKNEGPKADIATEILTAIKTTLLKPLKLNDCYTTLAAGAVTQRTTAAATLATAVKARTEATDAAARATADAKLAEANLALGQARLAIAAAQEKLRAKEQLVLQEMAAHREARIAQIREVTDLPAGKEDDTLKDLANRAKTAPPAPSFSKQPACE